MTLETVGGTMIVTLIAKTRIYTMSLPERVSGQYWLSDQDAQGHLRRVLNAEGIEGDWLLQSGEFLTLLDENGAEAAAVRLSREGTRVISARDHGTGETAQIYVEPSSNGRQQFRKYCLRGDCQLSIGRAPDNQIVFDNPYVSGHHARLLYQSGQWSVVDTQSRNGTFVNGCRTALEQLHPGDVIYLMGLKILIGGAFFAVNSPDNAVRVDAGTAIPFQPQETAADAGTANSPPVERFCRSPRFCRSVTEEEVRVDAPPNREKLEEVPLALLLGPALTMGVTALVMGAVAVNNLLSGTSTLTSTLPTIVMSLSMLCGTVLWPMLTKKNEKTRKNAVEQLRQNKYREYLDSVRNHLVELRCQQCEILTENSPDAAACALRITECRRNLWERSTEHADFLRLRLGLGTLPLAVKLRFPDQRFALEDDYLLHDLARLREEPNQLTNVPITLSLREDPVSGIIGLRQETLELVRSLLLQITALHSADEVKLVFLIDEEELPAWEFARWLPHAWDDAGTSRFLATTEQEARALSVGLEHELAERIDTLSRQHDAIVPHYVIILASQKLAEKAAFVAQALKAPPAAAFSCLSLAETLRELPKECSRAIELSGDGSAAIYDKRELGGERLQFHPETAAGIDVTAAAKSLANLEPDNQDEHFQMPGMISFLEMYGVGKVEHLNALARWKENNPVNSLQAPVGVGADGELFSLDLHEKFHGPHGLVAGMTGSGKSEFIITLILSLALNYSPDEVSFILIDYKGGGLAGAFEDDARGVRLPHLAGTITNLDGAAVKRSLISIQSELRRRQSVFNEARRISGEGTIDIYKYQKMYRNGQVAQAVPHLFIISDEFAELKQQQPEFMEQLISAARIGRSLGVHLILATQKPSGVVDDQIWSNSRFRVCFKVQERSDSMDMIKRPDAAALAETGRFYLQVGFNEYFALGQSAWSGAPYQPAERAVQNRNDSVAVLDHLGRIRMESRPRAPRASGARCSQVVAVVDYLSALASGEQIASRQLWLPAIPALLYVEELRSKYAVQTEPLTLAPVVGEYDDPFHQRQGLLTLQLTDQGNALIYGAAGSGKVQLLNAALYDLLARHSARELNLYLLDFGEESLQAFEKAPQVGGVLLSGDGERVTNLFKMLGEELKSRRRLFSDYGGDLRAYCRGTGRTVPQILVVLHNYSAFAEQFEQLEDSLSQLARDGLKYGITFLVTAAGASAVRYRIMQNFKQMLLLQLNDRSDYVGLVGSTDGVYPSAIPGRGIFKTDRTYEFQTARAARDDSTEALRRYAAELAAQSDCFARPVPTLPQQVDCTFVRQQISLEAFPVGIEKASLRLRTINLQENLVTVLTAQDAYSLDDPTQGLAETLSLLKGASVTVLDGLGLLTPDANAAYRCVSGRFTPAVDALFNELVRRNNTYKTAQSGGEALPQYPLWIYLITGFSEILSQLSAEGKDRLNTLMEKAERAYNVRFWVCDTARGLSALSALGWYKRLVTGSDGIWAGDGISDQYALKLGKISSDLYTEIPAGFGYAVRRGRPTLVKLLTRRGAPESEE